MACQLCLDKWGAEPTIWADCAEEFIAYYPHVKFHLGETDVDIPWFFREEVDKNA